MQRVKNFLSTCALEHSHLGNPPIENMFKHVYSEEHPLIEEQLAWLEGYEASFGDAPHDKGGAH